MVSVSEVFDLARSGERATAVSVLKQEFQRLQSSEHKVQLCEWIASCFENLNDYEQAAEWYEMAGLLSLSETGSELDQRPDGARAVRKGPFLSRAGRGRRIDTEMPPDYRRTEAQLRSLLNRS